MAPSVVVDLGVKVRFLSHVDKTLQHQTGSVVKVTGSFQPSSPGAVDSKTDPNNSHPGARFTYSLVVFTRELEGSKLLNCR